MFGLFGDLFDFNHDGKLDGFEHAAEYATFVSFVDEEEQRRDESFYEDDYDGEYDEVDFL